MLIYFAGGPYDLICRKTRDKNPEPHLVFYVPANYEPKNYSHDKKSETVECELVGYTLMFFDHKTEIAFYIYDKQI